MANRHLPWQADRKFKTDESEIQTGKWFYGFSSKEISKITHLVIKYGDEFKQKFAAHIGKRIND